MGDHEQGISQVFTTHKVFLKCRHRLSELQDHYYGQIQSKHDNAPVFARLFSNMRAIFLFKVNGIRSGSDAVFLTHTS